MEMDDTLLNVQEIVKRAKDAMKFCHSVIIPAMDAARETADAMETLMDIKYWPFPVYSDLLFSV